MVPKYCYRWLERSVIALCLTHVRETLEAVDFKTAKKLWQ